MTKDRLIANPSNLWERRTRRTPFFQKFEDIREAAFARWGETPISQENILQWVCAGCPNEAGYCLSAATHQPPIPGQGQSDPDAFVTQLLNSGVFIPKH